MQSTPEDELPAAPHSPAPLTGQPEPYHSTLKHCQGTPRPTSYAAVQLDVIQEWFIFHVQSFESRAPDHRKNGEGQPAAVQTAAGLFFLEQG
jgi:hypothetical protein